jgi:hypothetical protein
MDAWGLYHRGLNAFYVSTPKSFEEATELFDRAFELDDTFVPAIAMAAVSRTHLVLFGLPEDRGEILKVAEQQVAKAMTLDPTDAI